MRIEVKRVDWFRVFDDLKRVGISIYDMERDLQIPKTTLLSYKTDAEPKHCKGELIIEYWARITKNSRETVHRIST